MGFGPSISNAIKILTNLSKSGISVEILDLRTLNPIDENTILTSLKKTKRLCVIEYGWPRSGIASEIISIVTRKIKLKTSQLVLLARKPCSYSKTFGK